MVGKRLRLSNLGRYLVMDTQDIDSNTTDNLKIGNRWYQIHYTSHKSCTVYRYDNNKKTINGMGGPVFNCKINHLSDGWFVFLTGTGARDASTKKRIWPEVKKHLDAKSAPKSEV